MQVRVLEEGADIGLALDGDADRLIVVDELGHVVDGDQILGTLAKFLKETGRLRGLWCSGNNHVQHGTGAFLTHPGFKPDPHAVGDKHVLRAMRHQGCNLGGEQSGHMIFKRLFNHRRWPGLSALQCLGRDAAAEP